MMTIRLDHDQRLAILGDLIAGHQAEFGEITVEEMVKQAQQDRDTAALVRNSV